MYQTRYLATAFDARVSSAGHLPVRVGPPKNPGFYGEFAGRGRGPGRRFTLLVGRPGQCFGGGGAATMSDMEGTELKRRWYHLTPDRLVLLVLVVEYVLWLSNWLGLAVMA